ncbi:MAG: TlpA family protein disulfide reductase [Oscillospiraceae bacterium]|jgi:thiol-disulfide isomerase/thioredoxin|nr:TlpA family protein disulfide reductase [Oscillospiraceae bacterium]
MKLGKVLSIFLAAILILSVLPTAFAENEAKTIEVPQIGMTLRIPDAFQNTQGLLSPGGGYEIDDGIFYTEFVYYALSEEEYLDLANRFENDEFTDEDIERLGACVCYPLFLIGIDNSRDFSAINEFFDGEFNPEYAKEVYSENGFSYYCYVDEAQNDAFIGSQEEPYASEYKAVTEAIDELISKSDFYEPVSLYADIIGKTISFETTDTEGNPVTSKDLFGSNKVTMINIWASWCGPCVRELPELQAISERLQEKGCGLIGLLYDGNDLEALETGKQIMADNGVTYPVILPPENVDSLFPMEAYPTTYFVDSEGKILSEPIVGAYVDKYEAAVDALLAE